MRKNLKSIFCLYLPDPVPFFLMDPDPGKNNGSGRIPDPDPNHFNIVIAHVYEMEPMKEFINNADDHVQ